MRKYLLLVLVFIVLFFSTIHLYLTIPKETKYLTNISELYSSFTPYMEDYVNYRLQAIDCQPNEYYYDDSSVCFVCKDMDACFGYGGVMRAGGGKIHPKGIRYLTRVKEFDIKVVDFCEDGMASEFNCRGVNENVLECENIRFVGINKDGIFKCNEIKILLKEIDQFKNFVDSFCRFKKEELGEVTESLAFCGRYIIELKENKEITIGER